MLTERVALLSWRLHRVTRYETESIVLDEEKAEEGLARERRLGSYMLGAEHPQDVRGNLKDVQITYGMFKKLPGLPDDKHLPGNDAAGVLWGVSAYIEEEELEKVRLPSGVPDWAGVEGDTMEWDGWTVGLARKYVVSMASQAGETSEALLEAATHRKPSGMLSAQSKH